MSERKLTLFDATMLVMGGIVGVGIFFNPHQVAAAAPNQTVFLALWIVGGLAALCGGLTFAELGGTFPKDGGWYVFLREAFGPFPAFLFAWMVLGVVSTGAIAVMTLICVDNVVALVPALGPSGGTGATLTGVVILVAVTALALRGVKAGALFQNVCMIVKLTAIAALIVGAWLVFRPAAPAPSTVAVPLSSGLVGGAIHGLLPVFFSCGGWQLLCYVAPQVRDPQRNVPRALVIGVGGVLVTYLLINSAYLRVLGIDGLVTDEHFAGTMAERTLGATGGNILRAAMAVSALGVAVVTIVTSPWLYVAMAREGLFFARFAHVSPRTGAPVAALTVQLVLCLVYWLWGEARQLGDAVVFAEWIFHALVAYALLRLRSTRPDLPRPFRSPLWPLAPVAYLAIALVVVCGSIVQSDFRHVTAVGLGVLALGAVLYQPWRAFVARSQ